MISGGNRNPANADCGCEGGRRLGSFTAQACLDLAKRRTQQRPLGARLIGKDSPPITVVEGSRAALLVLCGQNPDHPTWSIARRAPVVTGRIGIAQPGLSMTKLRADLATASPSIAARQIREFLTVLHDATSSICDLALLASQ